MTRHTFTTPGSIALYPHLKRDAAGLEARTGFTVGVAGDAAQMLLLGDRVWWLPGPLARMLPEIDLHGKPVVEEAS